MSKAVFRVLPLALGLIFTQSFACLESASALPLEASKGITEFVAVGRPSALKINGKGSGPTGDLNLKKSGNSLLMNAQVQVDLDSMDSGIGMRDRHMKENYLETGKFKEAILKFQDAEVPAAIFASGGELSTTGTLALHGVEKPVQVSMKFSRNGDQVECESKFKIKLSDHGISIPRFSGITVADEVQVTAKTRVAHAALETK